MSIVMSRTALAKAMVALFLSASVMAGVAGSADAAPLSKCRNHPENYSFYQGKCLSDKRIEILKERAHHRGEDRR